MISTAGDLETLRIIWKSLTVSDSGKLLSLAVMLIPEPIQGLTG